MKRSLPAGIAGIVLLAMTCISCEHDSDNSGPTTIKKWDIEIKAANEVPPPPDRNDEGAATIELFSDNSLKFDVHIHNLASGDQLTNAHIHTGDATVSGPILIPFNPTFAGAGTSGVVTGLRQGQIDTLLGKPVYVNVHSQKFPAGLARGQLNP